MPAPDRNATSPSDIVVELRGVYKAYRQRQRASGPADLLRTLVRPTVRTIEALRGIDLEVRRGEVLAYAGPNGSGKSTTIKLLASLLAPDAGEVRALGLDPVRDRLRYVSQIGVVFGQRTELWWDQPVAASYAWKRVVWDIPRERYERMLGLLTELLDLRDTFRSLARELSLGQRMRADLGMALLHEPKLLLLDEPTLGLDVLGKREILRFIGELNRERQVTIVVTSHDMHDLESLAGRIVLIHHGAIAFDGPFDQLRSRFGDRRRLLLHTPGVAPILEGAVLGESSDGRHEYLFDAAQVGIASLLDQAAAKTSVLDVETHRVGIDEVIADIYQGWQREGQA